MSYIHCWPILSSSMMSISLKLFLQVRSTNKLLDDSHQPYHYLVESIRQRDIQINKMKQQLATYDQEHRFVGIYSRTKIEQNNFLGCSQKTGINFVNYFFDCRRCNLVPGLEFFFFFHFVSLLLIFCFNRQLQKEKNELSQTKNQLTLDLERLLNHKEVSRDIWLI